MNRKLVLFTFAVMFFTAEFSPAEIKIEESVKVCMEIPETAARECLLQAADGVSGECLAEFVKKLESDDSSFNFTPGCAPQLEQMLGDFGQCCLDKSR